MSRSTSLTRRSPCPHPAQRRRAAAVLMHRPAPPGPAPSTRLPRAGAEPDYCSIIEYGCTRTITSMSNLAECHTLSVGHIYKKAWKSPSTTATVLARQRRELLGARRHGNHVERARLRWRHGTIPSFTVPSNGTRVESAYYS